MPVMLARSRCSLKWSGANSVPLILFSKAFCLHPAGKTMSSLSMRVLRISVSSDFTNFFTLGYKV